MRRGTREESVRTGRTRGATAKRWWSASPTVTHTRTATTPRARAAPGGADHAARRRWPTQARAGSGGRADHLPRQLLPRPPQRHQRGAAAGAGFTGSEGAGDGAQPQRDLLLRRGRRADVARGDDRPEHQPEARRGGGPDPG